jgi:phosphoglycolate phosphatase
MTKRSTVVDGVWLGARAHDAPFVVFDLDGTLVRAGSELQRYHMGAMAAAIAAVVGDACSFRYVGRQLYYGPIDLAGFTDAGTVTAALRHHGVPPKDIVRLLPRIIADMVRRLESAGSTTATGRAGDLLPGARELLEYLRNNGIHSGMSTGNAQAVAYWKMRQVGLDHVLSRGGFGDVEVDRRGIASAAAAAMTLDCGGPGVLVGDTVADVTAASSAGLACVAVTTGAATAAQLLAAGADVVLDGLDSDNARLALRSLVSRQLRD